MSITLQLSPELKHRLQQKAEQAGLNIDRFINRFLEEKTAVPANTKPDSKKQEALLLRKINMGFKLEFWEKYAALIQKRNDASLSKSEYQSLLQLSNQIEEANARRIKYLAQLATLKEMDLDDLMATLGIAPLKQTVVVSFI